MTDRFRHLRQALLAVRLPVGILVCILLVCDVVIATIVDAHAGETGGVVVGLIFAQIALIATWTAWGTTSLFARTSTGLVAASLVGLALVSCIMNSGMSENRFLWMGMMITQWMTIQIPLWVLRLGFGWKLSRSGQTQVPATGSEVQFGLRQLLAWSAMVAITLGLGRWLLAGDEREVFRDTGYLLIAFVLLTIFNCLLAWPIIWAALTRFWPMWLAAAVGCGFGLTRAEIAVFRAVVGSGGDTDFFWFLNTFQTLGISIALLTLRFSGFRLMRFPGTLHAPHAALHNETAAAASLDGREG